MLSLASQRAPAALPADGSGRWHAGTLQAPRHAQPCCVLLSPTHPPPLPDCSVCGRGAPSHKHSRRLWAKRTAALNPWAARTALGAAGAAMSSPAPGPLHASLHEGASAAQTLPWGGACLWHVRAGERPQPRRLRLLWQLVQLDGAPHGHPRLRMPPSRQCAAQMHSSGCSGSSGGKQCCALIGEARRRSATAYGRALQAGSAAALAA